MITSEIQATLVSPPASAQATAPDSQGFSFRHLLSVLNPLQYLPVVGTIYRAMTGDVIPEAIREGGSMLVSGLLGGPIGMIANLAVTVAEKLTGIDPEKIVAAQFHPSARAAASVAELPAAEPTQVQAPPDSQQLAAYGVRPSDPAPHRATDDESADTLNGLELVRLSKLAAAAYSANQPVRAATALLPAP